MNAILLSMPRATTTKLNLLGKIVYTTGFACGTITKSATAVSGIVKADYNQLRINLKSL